MDAPLLSTRASLALVSLTSQLSALSSQQFALLSSISLTTQTLTHLPAYSTVAPTLAQIPAYTARLARLRREMVQQQQEVEALKRRALEAGKRRREHMRRVREREREEGERDRGVLRARFVGEERVGTPEAVERDRGVLRARFVGEERVGTPEAVVDGGVERDAEGVAAIARTRSSTPAGGAGTPVMGAVKVVKKRKARKADIQ